MRHVLGAMLMLPLLIGCAGGDAGRDQRHVVTVPFDYRSGNPANPAWRALMTAQDQCHNAGYQNAYPVGAAKSTCAEDACRAVQAYECVGLGYQTF